MQGRRLASILPLLCLACPSDAPSLDGLDPTGSTTAETGETGSSDADGGASTSATAESSETGTSTDDGADESDETETTGTTPPECIDVDLGDALGDALATISTQRLSNEASSECGGEDANEATFAWTAPFDGYFVIDTEGSTFDTVLYRIDECGGTVLECTDNTSEAGIARLVAPFEAGETGLFVVDGRAGQAGDAVLNIEAPQCPSADLSATDFPASFSNATGEVEPASACDIDGTSGPRRSFRYVASQAGLHSFRVTSEDFVPVLELEDGPICGGTQLSCNAPSSPYFGGSYAEVVRYMDPREATTVHVASDENTGNFQISVQPVDGACADETMSPGTPIERNIEDYDHRMVSSCGPVTTSGDLTADGFPSLTIALDHGGNPRNGSCTAHYTGGVAIAFSMWNDRCAHEFACTQATVNAATDGYEAELDLPDDPGVVHFVLVPLGPDTMPARFGNTVRVEIVCQAVG